MDYAPPPLPAKRGSSFLTKLGCGCGVLVLVFAIAFAAVGYHYWPVAKEFAASYQKTPVAATGKMVAALVPDIEFVSADEAAQLITFRDKKTGKTTTLSIQDLKAGKLSFPEGDSKEPPAKP